MKLKKYNLEVIYKRDKDVHLADALSSVRIPGQNDPDEFIQYEVDCHSRQNTLSRSMNRKTTPFGPN